MFNSYEMYECFLFFIIYERKLCVFAHERWSYCTLDVFCVPKSSCESQSVHNPHDFGGVNERNLVLMPCVTAC